MPCITNCLATLVKSNNPGRVYFHLRGQGFLPRGGSNVLPARIVDITPIDPRTHPVAIPWNNVDAYLISPTLIRVWADVPLGFAFPGNETGEIEITITNGDNVDLKFGAMVAMIPTVPNHPQ